MANGTQINIANHAKSANNPKFMSFLFCMKLPIFIYPQVIEKIQINNISSDIF